MMTKNNEVKNKTVKVLSTQGSQLGEIELSGSVFGVEPNTHIMYLALKRQLNNARAGLASAKTRAEVSGGGKKPWKQKGTGRARAGSLRSPLFRGGGVIFGPKPRSYETSLPQKARKLALKSALSAKLDIITIVKDFSEIKEAKTKAMAKVLKDLNAAGKVLIIADLNCEENKNLVLSARNIPSVRLLLPANLNVKDLVEADTIIATESAINSITERLEK
jgi:large subunit ribosomal protein L4